MLYQASVMSLLHTGCLIVPVLAGMDACKGAFSRLILSRVITCTEPGRYGVKSPPGYVPHYGTGPQ